MSIIVEPIAKALFDSPSRLSTKAAIIVLLVTMLFIADAIFGYSYFYHSNKKIEQIAKINTVLRDSTLNQEARNNVVKLRKEIIERSRLSDEIIPFLKNINIGRSIENSTTKSGNQRNAFWFHLTAAGYFYFLALIYIPAILFVNRSSLIRDLATGIFYSAFAFVLGFFFSWLFSFIPPIATSTWFWNYALNVVLQIGLFLIAANFSEEISDKSTIA